jgi:hypothetical protein
MASTSAEGIETFSWFTWLAVAVVARPPLPPLLPPLAPLPPLAALTPLLTADWVGFTLGGMLEDLKKKKKGEREVELSEVEIQPQ